MKNVLSFAACSAVILFSLTAQANIPGFIEDYGFGNAGTTAGVISLSVGTASSVSISGTRFTVYSSTDCSTGNLTNVYYSVTGGGSETLTAPRTLRAIPSVLYYAAVVTGGQTASNIHSVKFEILKPGTFCTQVTACVPETCSNPYCFSDNSDTPVSASLNSC
ncbi:MAG: hypothetical protein EBX40_03290 [Gammaproteobacteria bacterium]|nr:hypothetical protein [Gammaproteobacteria bacterium]